MYGFATRLARDPRAATAIEYGLIAALICLSALGAISALAGETIDMWNMVAHKVISAG
ncbi:MAG: Flp family type IVb pilin [Sphingomonas sanxanigenens]|uniref:Flp family type IVb pilin n=1 Tax=Sphingomonas sanxanigenens TaxID=397260 RepID=A0A2W5ADR5_9SPHN|nr:MAG: Flp family type IVb pilin [Sphingomonas sanxanigenens]